VWACSNPGSSSSPACFPAHATVQLVNGSSLRMDEISVGDKVLVNADKDYSDVFMFSHRMPASAVTADFVKLQTETGHELMLTPNHYLYVNGNMAVASTVKVGDTLRSQDGSAVIVTHVTSATAAGLYNPNTLHGDLVVNGIVVSTYTSDVNPTLAHAALWPVRLAYTLGGGADVLGQAFDNGSDFIASIMPDGKPRY